MIPTVLVIEDNPELRENTAEMLEVSGYKVQTAENGMDGFEKVLALRPDAVVISVKSPCSPRFLKSGNVSPSNALNQMSS